jgi:hypothetical protein
MGNKEDLEQCLELLYDSLMKYDKPINRDQSRIRNKIQRRYDLEQIEYERLYGHFYKPKHL